MSEPRIYTLDCGITIALNGTPYSRVCHAGITIGSGTRDELPYEAGIAHFWEHMAFKGTRKRKAYHILNGIDAVGGELNAFTTKEKICFFGSVTGEYTRKCLELLIDIVFNPVFPVKEIEKEKQVVLEEIAMYEDEATEKISEEFEKKVFNNHPLSTPILGYEETVKSMDQEKLFRFQSKSISVGNVSISVVSPVPDAKLLTYLNKLTSGISLAPELTTPRPLNKITQVQEQCRQKFIQAHCIIGGASPGINHPDKVGFQLLNNILGGPAMNSRLNMNIREKYGYMYDIHSGNTVFRDIGLFYIYFACDSQYYAKTRRLIQKELKKLLDGLSDSQFSKSVKQFKGQLAMAEESGQQQMIYAGRALLDYGHIPSLANLFEQLDNLSPDQLQIVAQKYLRPEGLSSLTFLPE